MRAPVGKLVLKSKHRLACGDCTDSVVASKATAGEKVDCVFTSPPYAVGIDYGSYQDTIENLRTMLPKLAELWKSLIVAGGFAVINYGDIVSGRELADSETPCEYPMSLEYWPVFRNAGYTLWSRRIWCKPAAACGSSRHCIGTNRAASNYEHVWTWKLPGAPPIDDQISGQWPSQAGWFDTSHDNHLEVGLKVHGAGMPVAVASRSITWHCRKGYPVFEPFGGTGTTLIAAHRLGRRAFLCELEPKYCDIIIRRAEAEGMVCLKAVA